MCIVPSLIPPLSLGISSYKLNTALYFGRFSIYFRFYFFQLDIAAKRAYYCSLKYAFPNN